jgi:hypothetical protein
MKKYLSPLLLIIFSSAIISCEFKTEIKTGDSKFDKFKNGINISSKGLDVSQAFLLFDDGTLVPEDNKVGVNQQVNLRLIIDGGWKAENGKVSIGASEKIETDKGDVVLNEPDLFQSIGDVSVQDAGVITLKAVITSIDKLYDHFKVSFKVWDKKGDGSVEGSYKLYIK